LLRLLLNLVSVILRITATAIAVADFVGLRARAPASLRLRCVCDGDGRWPRDRWLWNVVHTTGARDQSQGEYQSATHGCFPIVEILPNSITEEQHGTNATALTITRVFPMQIRRRGFEMRLVIQGSRAPAPLADLALIKAIARGRQWSDDLLAGRAESAAVIARREGVLPNYVRRLTRLAFLAPRIVEAIATGHQPAELTAKALTERIELPLIWSEQERAVGIG